MYHGEVHAGFPKHPHRGFETVTIARCGFVDHSDSLGAAGRFGGGDVQWMTAGKGISHSEMFPLLKSAERNRAELFQIWLNLPAKSKMAEPFFTMLWAESIPKLTAEEGVEVAVVAGRVEGTVPALPPPCPPSSWAQEPGADVAIITVKLAPGKGWTLPASAPGLNRAVYFFVGPNTASVGDKSVPVGVKVDCASDQPLPLANTGDKAAEFLVR